MEEKRLEGRSGMSFGFTRGAMAVAGLGVFSAHRPRLPGNQPTKAVEQANTDRKSTRLNSSHLGTSYAVFCLKTKKHRAQLSPAYKSYANTRATTVGHSRS